MVARNALLMLLLAAASGRLRADTVQCVLEAEVTYPTGGGAPVPVCSSKCACSESALWCQGTTYHRIPELTANYQSMVKAVYQYGALTSCTLVPYQTTEQLAAQSAVYQDNVELCNAMAAAEATTASTQVETTTVVKTSTLVSITPNVTITTTTTTTTTAHKPATPSTTNEKTITMTTKNIKTVIPTTSTECNQTTTPTAAAPTPTTPKPTTTTTTTTPKPTTTTKRAPVYSCPTGYKMYSTTKCYKVVKNKVTWTAARDKCVADGGYLATIGSAAENTFLGVLVFDNTWFGLNDLVTTYKFEYTNGSPVNYTNWDSGEPNNHKSKEHCGEIRRNIFRWNDHDCTNKMHYACEQRVTVT